MTMFSFIHNTWSLLIAYNFKLNVWHYLCLIEEDGKVTGIGLDQNKKKNEDARETDRMETR